MSSKEKLAAALSRLEELHAEVALLAKLAKRFPDEPPVGSVIRILKRFDDGWRGPTPVYTYVAVRATPKGWYMTGRRSGDKGFHSWDTLVEFIGDSSAELVAGWTPIREEHGG